MSCEHCNGRYLKGMVDVSKKGSLLQFGISHAEAGGKGFLLSGGCDSNGAVPFPAHIFQELSEIKDTTDLTINMHVGLLDDKTARRISSSQVDNVSFDLVLDDETISEVLHIDRPSGDYVKTLDLLDGYGIPVSPHILAGLNFGTISWEFDAVKELSRRHYENVILIILIPTKGTGMHTVEPPENGMVLALAREMRRALDGRLVLGCMRPKGSIEIEMGLLDSGFDGIVLPSRRTLGYIDEKGWEIQKHNKCCCM